MSACGDDQRQTTHLMRFYAAAWLLQTILGALYAGDMRSATTATAQAPTPYPPAPMGPVVSPIWSLPAFVVGLLFLVLILLLTFLFLRGRPAISASLGITGAGSLIAALVFSLTHPRGTWIQNAGAGLILGIEMAVIVAALAALLAVLFCWANRCKPKDT